MCGGSSEGGWGGLVSILDHQFLSCWSITTCTRRCSIKLRAANTAAAASNGILIKVDGFIFVSTYSGVRTGTVVTPGNIQKRLFYSDQVRARMNEESPLVCAGSKSLTRCTDLTERFESNGLF
jgi:hypothetical protein